MSIRVRLVLSGVVVAALTLGLFGLLFDRLVAAAAPDDQDAALASLAERTARAVERSDPESLAPSTPLLRDDPDDSIEPIAAVLDAGGTVLTSDGQIDEVLRALPPAYLSRPDGAVTVRLPSGTLVRVQGERWQRRDPDRAGVAIAAQSTRFTERQVRDFRVLLVVAGFLTLIVAAIATWVVSGRALRPLRQLASTADQIGRTGDLGQRLPPTSSRDQLGVLTASFNGMLDRLQSSRRQLTETLEAQRRFLADVSHELRSPLTTIRSNAGFLQERPDATVADRNEALADIGAESERMSRLVDDLLTLARAEAAGETLEREPVDLEPVLTDVAGRARAAGRPIVVHVSGQPTVLGDDHALRRLVWTLVDNGIRHGGGDVDIAVTQANGRIEIAVGDRGPGIEVADLDAVFERFRQGSTRSGDGVGLGLAIARHLAEAQGGSIRAERRPGGGALFVVELPAVAG